MHWDGQLADCTTIGSKLLLTALVLPESLSHVDTLQPAELFCSSQKSLKPSEAAEENCFTPSAGVFLMARTWTADLRGQELPCHPAHCVAGASVQWSVAVVPAPRLVAGTASNHRGADAKYIFFGASLQIKDDALRDSRISASCG